MLHKIGIFFNVFYHDSSDFLILLTYETEYSPRNRTPHVTKAEDMVSLETQVYNLSTRFVIQIGVKSISN